AVLRTEGNTARPRRRNTSHTAPPAVDVITSSDDESRAGDGLGSGSQYSHSPWSLQRRALSRPSLRSRPMVVRLMPSVAETCLLVSMPASRRRALRLLSLAEKRTH